MTATEVASHRGGALLWPENSALAFRRALALGVEQLELDVHLSADGVPVVMHDATLDRMTDGRGPVRAQDLASLRRLRVKGTDGEPPPTLAEAAVLVRNAGRVLRLEIKADATGAPYPGVVAACLDVLDATGMRARTVVMSFQPLTVADCPRDVRRRVLLLVSPAWRGMGAPGAIALCRASGAEELGLALPDWDVASVAALRAAGIGVSAWAADDPATIGRAYALGLDAIATDDPPLALRLRDAR